MNISKQLLVVTTAHTQLQVCAIAAGSIISAAS